MTKQEIREQVRHKKRLLSGTQIANASRELLQKLVQTAAYQEADCICGYMSCNQEVCMLPVLRQAKADGKQIAIPKILAGEMQFVILTDLDAVAPGFYGILEPIADKPIVQSPDALIVLPGLAFDRQGNRIGYGGGFYDRYLTAHPGHPTIALCYAFQLYDCLPAEPTDMPVQQVLWTNT